MSIDDWDEPLDIVMPLIEAVDDYNASVEPGRRFATDIGIRRHVRPSGNAHDGAELSDNPPIVLDGILSSESLGEFGFQIQGEARTDLAFSRRVVISRELAKPIPIKVSAADNARIIQLLYAWAVSPSLGADPRFITGVQLCFPLVMPAATFLMATIQLMCAAKAFDQLTELTDDGNRHLG